CISITRTTAVDKTLVGRALSISLILIFCVKVTMSDKGKKVYTSKSIKLSDRSLSDAAKEARSSLKSARKDEEDENLAVEGQLYGPGIAD
ncbi:hypothetical protein X777_08141, partial [Ooceraea biroi]